MASMDSLHPMRERAGKGTSTNRLLSFKSYKKYLEQTRPEHEYFILYLGKSKKNPQSVERNWKEKESKSTVSSSFKTSDKSQKSSVSREEPYRRVSACNFKFACGSLIVLTGCLGLGYVLAFGNPFDASRLKTEIEQREIDRNKKFKNAAQLAKEELGNTTHTINQFIESGQNSNTFYISDQQYTVGGLSSGDWDNLKKEREDAKCHNFLCEGLRSLFGSSQDKGGTTFDDDIRQNIKKKIKDAIVEEQEQEGSGMIEHAVLEELDHILEYFVKNWEYHIKNYKYRAIYMSLLQSGKMAAYSTLGGSFLSSDRPIKALYNMEGMVVNKEFQEYVQRDHSQLYKYNGPFYSNGLHFLGFESGASVRLSQYTPLEAMNRQLYSNQILEFNYDESTTYASTQIGMWDDVEFDPSTQSVYHEGDDSKGLVLTETSGRTHPSFAEYDKKDKDNLKDRQAKIEQSKELGENWKAFGKMLKECEGQTFDTEHGEKAFTYEANREELEKHYMDFRNGMIIMRGNDPRMQIDQDTNIFIDRVIRQNFKVWIKWAEKHVELKKQKYQDDEDYLKKKARVDNNVATLLMAGQYAQIGGALVALASGTTLAATAGVGSLVVAPVVAPALVMGMVLGIGGVAAEVYGTSQKNNNEIIYEEIANIFAESDEEREQFKENVAQLFSPSQSTRDKLQIIPSSQAGPKFNLTEAPGITGNVYYKILALGEGMHPSFQCSQFIPFKKIDTSYAQYYDHNLFTYHCRDWIEGLPKSTETTELLGLLSSSYPTDTLAIGGQSIQIHNGQSTGASAGTDRLRISRNDHAQRGKKVTFLPHTNPMGLNLSPTKERKFVPLEKIYLEKPEVFLQKVVGFSKESLLQRVIYFFKIKNKLQEKVSSMSDRPVSKQLGDISEIYIYVQNTSFPKKNKIWEVQLQDKDTQTKKIVRFKATNDVVELNIRYNIHIAPLSLLVCIFNPLYFAYFQKILPYL